MTVRSFLVNIYSKLKQPSILVVFLKNLIFKGRCPKTKFLKSFFKFLQKFNAALTMLPESEKMFELIFNSKQPHPFF